MKFNKGMFLDGNPNQNPKNTTRINKNVVVLDKYGSIVNEHGFLKQLSFNKTIKKVLPLDKGDFFVLMGNDEAGIVKDNVYTPVIQLPNLIDSDVQDIRYYINNEYQRIVIWNTISGIPKMINVDIDNSLSTLKSLSLTNYANKVLDLTTDVVNEGSLKSGAYYIIYCFEKKDKSITNWFRTSKPVYITNSNSAYDYANYDGVESGINTNKSINIVLTGCDLDYSYLRIGYVYSENKQLKAYYVKKIQIGYTISATITGQESIEELSLNEVIVDSLMIRNVKHLTDNGKGLIGADFKTFSEPSHQKKVNNIIPKWYSHRINLIDYKTHHVNSVQKSFAHGEVYALYIRMVYYWGAGKWYHVCGRLANTTDKQPNSINPSFMNYEITDTCSTNGSFSYHENQNELYPNNGEYPTGNVRHVKFPSKDWMRANVYNTDSLYGISYSDLLGVYFENINLSDFKDCDGNTPLFYEIGYAQRNNLNNRIVGQSIIILNRTADSLYSNNQLISVGGNNIYINNGSDEIDTSSLAGNISVTDFRTYPFEILRQGVNPNPNYLKIEYKLSGQNDVYVTPYDGIGVNNNEPICGCTDYTENTTSSNVSFALGGNLPIEIAGSSIIENNIITEKINNLLLERYYNIKLNNLQGGELAANLLQNAGSFTANIGTSTIGESTFLVSLMSIEKNYYIGFDKQNLIINCDKPIDTLSVNNVFFGGDVFKSDYSIIIYGINKKEYTDDPDESNTKNFTENGIRFTKRFLCESQYNINLRFISSNLQFKDTTGYYPKIPKSALWTYLNKGFLQILKKDINPNDFVNGYSDDYHAQNILDYSEIYNHTNDVIRYNFSILRNDDINWRVFKVDNIYTFLDRTKGKISNLQATSEYLYIHFEKSLYITRPRTELITTDGDIIRTGVGDILEVEPQEIIHDRQGYLGTQHKSSCLLTVHGYIFCDSEKGIWWVVNKNNPKEISADGLHNFFRDNLNGEQAQSFTIVYDEKYDRLLITRKFKELPDILKNKYKGVWINDQNFINSLVSGDIVFKDGKYKRIK